MIDENTHSALLELKLIGDILGSFRVARYQRGYRWGKLEVERLLSDIWESKGEPYCLQPVVVKRDSDSDSSWELVDGQQRLTTLFLIFMFMQRERLQNASPPYSITYQTRLDCAAYLQELDAERADSNIDFFHLYRAYEYIRVWFDAHGAARRQHVANKFYGYLFESVHVIWYEAPKGLDSTTLFTRLNIGRIPLTDAELFKALLLSRSRDGVGATDRAHEIAAQWDGIERDLRHADVWAFVADEASDSPTRITLLLDTIAAGPRGRARPRFHTFDVLREMVEQGKPSAVWDRIVQLHALIIGWYENRDYYHKIGYLVAVGQRFSDLVALAAGKTKREFEAALDARIRDSLDLTPSRVMELSYDSDASKCGRVLLLMNVETVRRMKDSTERYSFRIHRSHAWSLEHIHAQHTESLTRAEQWKEWLRLHREALVDLPAIGDARRAQLLARIDGVGEQIDRQDFHQLARDVTAAFTLAVATTATVHPVHSVSNLALLASGHNSALSNAVFEVKRRRILELDRQGAYIPICTRQVFLKYYTDADAQQICYWSSRDREAYLNAILSPDGGVGAYLKPELPAP